MTSTKKKAAGGRPVGTQSVRTVERDEMVFKALVKPMSLAELAEKTGETRGHVYGSLHRLRAAGRAAKVKTGSRTPDWSRTPTG